MAPMVTIYGHEGRGFRGGCSGIARHHLLTPGIHLSLEYGLGIKFFTDKSCEKQHSWLDSKDCACGLSNLIILSLKVLETVSICY
jgi:hypothetical protein